MAKDSFQTRKYKEVDFTVGRLLEVEIRLPAHMLSIVFGSWRRIGAASKPVKSAAALSDRIWNQARITGSTMQEEQE